MNITIVPFFVDLFPAWLPSPPPPSKEPWNSRHTSGRIIFGGSRAFVSRGVLSWNEFFAHYWAIFLTYLLEHFPRFQGKTHGMR